MNKNAYILLEVMAAIVIAALWLPAMARAVHGLSVSQRAMRERCRAYMAASWVHTQINMRDREADVCAASAEKRFGPGLSVMIDYENTSGLLIKVCCASGRIYTFALKNRSPAGYYCREGMKVSVTRGRRCL